MLYFLLSWDSTDIPVAGLFSISSYLGSIDIPVAGLFTVDCSYLRCRHYQTDMHHRDILDQGHQLVDTNWWTLHTPSVPQSPNSSTTRSPLLCSCCDQSSAVPRPASPQFYWSQTSTNAAPNPPPLPLNSRDMTPPTPPLPSSIRACVHNNI